MARRTFSSYKNEVLHSLGNPDASDLDIDEGDIVNDALIHLATMHPWRWREQGTTTLSLVADQNYVELPSDFGLLVAVEHDQGFTRVMIPTTWAELLRFRQDAVEDWSRSYWFVINTGVVDSGSPQDGLQNPRLELYPTPASNQADALSLVYIRNLRPMAADGDTPQWPRYMDRCLSLMARAFAAGDYDEAGESSYGQQLRALLPDLMAEDGRSKGSFGTPRSGLYPRTTPISPFYPRNIPDPTYQPS